MSSETKTMQDAVDAYTLADRVQAERDLEKQVKDEEKLRDALKSIGLTPLKISGIRTTFDFDGKEVVFEIWKASGTWTMQAVTLCPVCKDVEIQSEAVYGGLSLENFGKLLVSPNWETYRHTCASVISKKIDARDRLVDALREVLNLDGEF